MNVDPPSALGRLSDWFGYKYNVVISIAGIKLLTFDSTGSKIPI